MAKKDEISISELMDWLEGRLDRDRSLVVAEAVEKDPALRKSADWFRQFLEVSASTQLAPPDAAAHQAAVAYFEAQMQGRRQSVWQTLRGLLTSDSHQRPMLAGVRNMALEAKSRQLIFSSPAADIAINIHGRDKMLDLTGQVFPLGKDQTYYTVQLEQVDAASDDPGQVIDLLTTDATGKFSVSDLRAGHYVLVVTADQYEVIIDSLELTLA